MMGWFYDGMELKQGRARPIPSANPHPLASIYVYVCCTKESEIKRKKYLM
jgi:hypothetical protein